MRKNGFRIGQLLRQSWQRLQSWPAVTTPAIAPQTRRLSYRYESYDEARLVKVPYAASLAVHNRGPSAHCYSASSTYSSTWMPQLQVSPCPYSLNLSCTAKRLLLHPSIDRTTPHLGVGRLKTFTYDNDNNHSCICHYYDTALLEAVETPSVLRYTPRPRARAAPEPARTPCGLSHC